MGEIDEDHQNYTLRSTSNFWFSSVSDGNSFFPVKMCGKDTDETSIDALQLSAVSPVFHDILDDAFLSCQCSWGSDNISVIFAETNIESVRNFVHFVTYGNCTFSSTSDMNELKAIIKHLAINYSSIIDEDEELNDIVDCKVKIKEEDDLIGNDNDDDYKEDEWLEPQSGDNMDDDIEDDELYEEEKVKTKRKRKGKVKKKEPREKKVKEAPESESSFKCEECGEMIYGERDSWKAMLHMSQHIGDEALKCVHCKFVLRDSTDWKNHMSFGNNDAKKRKVCCGVCGEVFVGQWNYLVHKRDAHDNGKPIQCELCPVVFKDSNHWRHHKSDHVKVVCQICGLSLIKNNLKKHMDVKHNPKSVELPCRVCGKVFMHEDNRKLHEKNVHATERDKICDICGKTFAWQASLKNHVDSVHLNNSKWVKLEKNKYCNMCGKAFKTKSELLKHEKRHNPTGYFKCEFCEKHFPLKERLRRHVLNYHGQPKYECLICGKHYRILDKAKRHCLVHNPTKIKSFQCERCHEWFENRDYGRTHIKHFHMNDEEKPKIEHIMTDEFKELMKNVMMTLHHE